MSTELTTLAKLSEPKIPFFKRQSFWYLVVFILALIFNWLYLYIPIMPAIGIYLGLALTFKILSIIIIKIYRKKKGIPEKEKDTFIYSDRMARKMKVNPIEVQYESSLISMTFLAIGMLAFSIYYVFIAEGGWIFKAFYVFNAGCGAVLLLSNIVTQYQQYVSFKETSRLMAEQGSYAEIVSTNVEQPKSL